MVEGVVERSAARAGPARLTIDPPDFAKEHIRFVANCKMHVEGEMQTFGVRWALPPQGQWQQLDKAFVGTVSGCSLSEG